MSSGHGHRHRDQAHGHGPGQGHHHAPANFDRAFAIGIVVVNTTTALLFLRGRRNGLNIRGAFLHMAADALVSAGVVVAGGLALWFGWIRLDPVVSLLIAAVIVVGTWSLFRQSLHLLFDGVPDSVDLPAVQALLASLPGVARVHDLHVWAMGTSATALTAHLVMPDAVADDAFQQHATEQLHARFGIDHVTLQVVRVPFTTPCFDPARTWPSRNGAQRRGPPHRVRLPTEQGRQAAMAAAV